MKEDISERIQQRLENALVALRDEQAVDVKSLMDAESEAEIALEKARQEVTSHYDRLGRATAAANTLMTVVHDMGGDWQATVRKIMGDGHASKEGNDE